MNEAVVYRCKFNLKEYAGKTLKILVMEKAEQDLDDEEGVQTPDAGHHRHIDNPEGGREANNSNPYTSIFFQEIDSELIETPKLGHKSVVGEEKKEHDQIRDTNKSTSDLAISMQDGGNLQSKLGGGSNSTNLALAPEFLARRVQRFSSFKKYQLDDSSRNNSSFADEFSDAPELAGNNEIIKTVA